MSIFLDDKLLSCNKMSISLDAQLTWYGSLRARLMPTPHGLPWLVVGPPLLSFRHDSFWKQNSLLTKKENYSSMTKQSIRETSCHLRSMNMWLLNQESLADEVELNEAGQRMHEQNIPTATALRKLRRRGHCASRSSIRL